jgi:hypothetical protein
MHVDAMRLERTLRLRRQTDRRKGRKGRKLPAPLRRVGFVNDINHLDAPWQPDCAARRGGNRRKLAETPCKNSARDTVRGFTVSLLGSTPVQNDYRTTGNTGNSPGSSRDWLCLAGGEV